MTATPTIAAPLAAQDLFRAAYENRYTWDSNFPGYTCDVTLQMGEQVMTGTARVNKDLSAEVFDITDEEALKLLKGQLWEVAIHRVRRTFEQTHSQNTFRYATADGASGDDGAVEILLGGKSEGDRYKVRNNEVVLVHRHIHGVVVTINTFSSHDTGAGYLSHTYDSVYHDPKTGEQKKGRSEFEDDYEQVDGYFILNRRVVRSEAEPTLSFTFSNIALLPAE